MGKMSFSVPHSLSKDEARKRIEGLGQHWLTKYGLKVDWSGDKARLAGKVMGIPVEADLEVLDHAVSAVATDPGFLFRDKAKKYVQEKLTRALGPSPTAHD
jgi:hypothetical protein